MKIETKLNIATALAVIVFGFALCASAVTADWESVKRLVGDVASGGSNNVSAAVSTLRGEIASATPSDYGSVKSAALSAVQPNDLEPYCTIEAARQMTNGVVRYVMDEDGNLTAITIGERNDNLNRPIGYCSFALGWRADAARSYCVSIGQECTAYAIGAFASGFDAAAYENYSFVRGNYVRSYGYGGIAIGCRAWLNTPDSWAFIWNGDQRVRDGYYYSKGPGSFAVNPVGGVSGFWIGETNLATHIANLTTGKVDRSEISDLIADAKPSDYETVKSNASAGSAHASRTDNPHGLTAAQIGAASADDLAPLASDISRAYQYSRTISLYMTGNTNAWFAGTNYVIGADAAARRHFAWEAGMDAATVPCSMALWEIRDGVKQCVWDQRDWPTWYWSFKADQMKAEINASNDVFRAAVNQQINSDENHAWAKRYASSGRVNPDPSTTFIDTKSVCLSPGMSWETVATVDGCGYWTIVGDGAVIGGSGTNAVLDIKDFEGNSIIKITKGEHRLAWVERGEIVGQSLDSNGWVCFDMLADVQPVGYFSTTLESADFVTESDAGCPAQYTWENRGGGVWRVHYLLKPGIVSNACFAKFQVEVEGKTRIQYEADTVINGGLIFNGVKIAPVIPSGSAVGSTVTWKVVE